MNTLRVGFSSHKRSAFSWLIRTVTKSKVSHSYVHFICFGRHEIFQASGLVVNVQPEAEFEKKAVNIEEYDVPVSDDQYEKAMKLRETELGKPYSIGQIFGFIWVLGMRQLAKKRVPNPFGNGKYAYICVELVADMVGISNSESMTPEDLRRWCEENSFKVR